MQNEIVSGQRSLSAPAATFSTSGRSLPADVLPHSLHSSALILRPCAGPLPRSHVPARSCQNRMSEWHRLRDPVRTPTPLPLGRYRGIPLSRSFVRIGCSGFAVRPGEEGRDSRLPLLYIWAHSPSRRSLPAACFCQSRFNSLPSGWNCTLVCPPSTKSSIPGK